MPLSSRSNSVSRIITSNEVKVQSSPRKTKMCRSQSQPVLSMKVVNENQHEKKKIKLKKKKKKFTLAANVSMTRYNLGMKNKLFFNEGYKNFSNLPAFNGNLTAVNVFTKLANLCSLLTISFHHILAFTIYVVLINRGKHEN